MQPSTRLARRRPFCLPTPPELPDDDFSFTPEGLRHEVYVEVVLSGPIDPASGMITDLRHVDRALARAVAPLESGARRPAPTEELARELFETLRGQFNPATLEKLRLGVSRDAWVDVWP